MRTIYLQENRHFRRRISSLALASLLGGLCQPLTSRAEELLLLKDSEGAHSAANLQNMGVDFDDANPLIDDIFFDAGSLIDGETFADPRGAPGESEFGPDAKIGNTDDGRTEPEFHEDFAHALENALLEQLESGDFDVTNPALSPATELSTRDWLVLAREEFEPDIRGSGLITETISSLENIGMLIVRITALGSEDFTSLQQRLNDISDTIIVDRNHLYFAETGDRPMSTSAAVSATEGLTSVRDLINMPGSGTLAEADIPRIGLVDTAVNTGHPALLDARISSIGIKPEYGSETTTHGTAVASILLGQTATYQGLLPGASLFCASVFFETDDGNLTTTTELLVHSLNWLAGHNVSVVNMSLTGPYNLVLRKVLEAVHAQGTTVVAAVGNHGPNSDPRYPAAYPDVVAVTAVSANKKIYRLAGRGEHLDFAAPGVLIPHADHKDGYDTSSGTSMATPFVTAFLAAYQHRAGKPLDQLLPEIKAAAGDLGDLGHDPVYGYGFIGGL